MWSGRFAGGPDPDVFAFGRSFPFDRRLVEDDITGSIAWAQALGAANVLSPADTTTIVGGLEAIRAEIGIGGLQDPPDGADEDIHSFVERRLIERIGEAGKRLHTGRSRNEQVSLDLRLYLRRRIPVIQQELRALALALVERAESLGDAVMPSYTHLRRAQPVLAAHFFLSHVAPIERDLLRFEQAAAAADAMPLGSGAIAGTSYDIDTGALAARLGFSKVVANSLDAAGDRDFAAEFLFAVSLAGIHLSRLCEDLIIFSTDEFAFFDLDDAVATGSSLMPQKKNPDPLELVRGKSARGIGHLMQFLTLLKSVPAGYSKDLQEDKESIFDAEDTLIGSLKSTAAVVRALTFNAGAARAAASGLLLATEVADYLVSKGMPFRSAHEVVGGIVRDLAAKGEDFSSLSPADWKAYDALFDEDVEKWLSPEAAVRNRRTPQSTNPDAVRSRLRDAAARLKS
ncbi:MAG TPA: argininosuccinate lyase [Vicinamibacterales bacterium]|nr:argininosuccinate lyase [Vicinamibacterales bacterium]